MSDPRQAPGGIQPNNPIPDSPSSRSKAVKGVDHKNWAHRYMLWDWQLIDALKGGTRKMREYGQMYLPKRKLEDNEDYKKRLAKATLLPTFIETSKSHTGRVFASRMTLNDDIPEWINDEVFPNVDLQGRAIHEFAVEWFQEGLDYGLAHVLVDAPEYDGDLSQLTVAKQQELGLRPYLIRIHARNVLGWQHEGGELTQLRVAFSREVQDGEFATRTVDQIRVYYKDRIDVYEQFKNDASGLMEWSLAGTKANHLECIPLVTFYTKRTGFMIAEPPMRELANLNVKHWRMKSALDELIETAMVPILCTSGVNTNDEIVIGAKHMVRLPTGAEMKYVEHTGKAIEAGQAEVKNIVEDMRQSGGAVLKPVQNRGSRTESEVSDEAARDNSSLGRMVTDFEDAMRSLLAMVAYWRDDTEETDYKKMAGGTVTCNPNLDPDFDPNQMATSLSSLNISGVISKRTVFENVKNAGLVRVDRTWAEEKELIDSEGLPADGEGGDPKPGDPGYRDPAKKKDPAKANLPNDD